MCCEWSERKKPSIIYVYVRNEEQQPTLVLYVEEFTHLL